jgi:TatD DNase family protein
VVGLHPVQTVPGLHDEDEVGEGGKPFISKGEVFDYDAIKALAQDPKTVAIGECGLDYYGQRVMKREPELSVHPSEAGASFAYVHTTPESEAAQREAFVAQIHLANELGKPLMLHIRNGKDTSKNAYKDVADILKSEAKVRGNAHFFAGSVDDARLYLDMGFSVSFTGVVTFTRDYDEVVRYVPADMIHAETDAPYVSPKPYRGQRNEPLHVIEVAQKLAEIRGVDPEQFREQLLKNAESLYSISHK